MEHGHAQKVDTCSLRQCGSPPHTGRQWRPDHEQEFLRMAAAMEPAAARVQRKFVRTNTHVRSHLDSPPRERAETEARHRWCGVAVLLLPRCQPLASRGQEVVLIPDEKRQWRMTWRSTMRVRIRNVFYLLGTWDLWVRLFRRREYCAHNVVVTFSPRCNALSQLT